MKKIIIILFGLAVIASSAWYYTTHFSKRTSEVYTVETLSTTATSTDTPIVDTKNDTAVPKPLEPTEERVVNNTAAKECYSREDCIVKNLLSCTTFATSTEQEMSAKFNGVKKTFTVKLDTKILGKTDERCSVKSTMLVTLPDNPKAVTTETSCSVNLKPFEGVTSTSDSGALLQPLSLVMLAIHDIQRYIHGETTKEQIENLLAQLGNSKYAITDERYFAHCTTTVSVK